MATIDDEIVLKMVLDYDQSNKSINTHIALQEKIQKTIKQTHEERIKALDKSVKLENDYNKSLKETYSEIGKQAEQYSKLEDVVKTVSQDLFTNSTNLDKSNHAFAEYFAQLHKFGLSKLKINSEDLEILNQKVSTTEDDLQALNIVLATFQEKAQLNLDDEEVRSFSEEISKAQQYLSTLSNEALETAGNHKTLKSELRQIKEEMASLDLAGERNSKRYKDLQLRAGELNNTIANVNDEVKLLGSDTKGLDRIIGSVNSLVGAFSIAEGAQALLGIESEEWQKTLVRLNGAVAILNGLQAIQAELTNKTSFGYKALTYVQTQYAIATNASEKATTRLKAALITTGIGALVIAVGYLAANWEKVSKWIGISSDESERNKAINEKASELYGEQIAKLKILIDKVRENVKAHNLSFQQKKEAVNEYNRSLGDTLGSVKSYAELEQKLIANGDAYVDYLIKKAKAEAVYQLAIETTKESLIERSRVENGGDGFSQFDGFVFGGGNKISNSALNKIEEYANAGLSFEQIKKSLPNTFSQLNESFEGDVKIYIDKIQKSKKLLSDGISFEKEVENTAKKLGLAGKKATGTIKSYGEKQVKAVKDNNDAIKRELENYKRLIEELTNKIASTKIQNNDNELKRRIEEIEAQFNAEKESYKKQVDELKVSNEKKKEAQDLFNKLYNEADGQAYLQLQKQKNEILQEYEVKRQEIILKAQTLTSGINGTSANLERQAIAKKYEEIRKELELQISLTEDVTKKAELQNVITSLNPAQEKETNDFDIKQGISIIEQQSKISEQLVNIVFAQNSEIINAEKLKQKQIIDIQIESYKKQIELYNTGLNDEKKASLQSLVEELQSTTDISQASSISEQIKELAGSENQNAILELIEKIIKLKKELDTEIESPKFKFDNALSSFKGFGDEVAQSIGKISGASKKQMEALSFAIASTLENTWSAITQGIENEANQHQQRISMLEESINEIESELDRERQLYEDGFANNYEARQQDLESLKAQKAQEEEELKKAQQKKALLQKAEFLTDTASQLSNLITSATSIFKWASKIPVVGVPLAIGLIATMFGAFAAAKVTAYNAIGKGTQYREGVKKGKISLSGPSHEQGGFGLINNKTGEQVAEFEGNEDVYVFNAQQKAKYKDALQAILDDAQGRSLYGGTTIDFIKNHQTPKDTAKNVLIVHQEATNKKNEENKQIADSLKELKQFRKDFQNEFSGYKEERENQEHYQETNEFYVIKTKRKTTKIRKKND